MDMITKLGWGTVYGVVLAAVAYGWKYSPGISLALGSSALGAVARMREQANLGAVAAIAGPGVVGGAGLLVVG
jgi:hypothetical protein